MSIIKRLVPTDAIAIPNAVAFAATLFAIVLAIRIGWKNTNEPDLRLLSSKPVFVVDAEGWVNAIRSHDLKSCNNPENACGETLGPKDPDKAAVLRSAIIKRYGLLQTIKLSTSFVYFSDTATDDTGIALDHSQHFMPKQMDPRMRELFLEFGSALGGRIEIHQGSALNTIPEAFVQGGMPLQLVGPGGKRVPRSSNSELIAEVARTYFRALKASRFYAVNRKTLEKDVIEEAFSDEGDRADAADALVANRIGLLGLALQSAESYPVADARLRQKTSSPDAEISIWIDGRQMEPGSAWNLPTFDPNGTLYLLATAPQQAAITGDRFYVQAPRFQAGLKDVFDMWSVATTCVLLALYFAAWRKFHLRDTNQ